MPHDQTVAKTILEQLGGRRFIAMTGASSFASDHNALSFRIPRRGPRPLTALVITLTDADDYTIESVRMAGSFAAGNLRTERKTEAEGVYCENLRETFTRITGLETHL